MRELMVYHQVEGRGIADQAVLDAMREIPREKFVPEDIVNLSYTDSALPLDLGQSISQPYIVGYMAEALKVLPHHKVLEVGTGSGYSSAILSRLSKSVYTIEIIQTLAEEASERLWVNGFENVFVKAGDGHLGWKEKGPFDRIILTAAPDHLSDELIDQLAPEGVIVAPIGNENQFLFRVTKKLNGELEKELMIPVKFVQMAYKRQDGHVSEQKVA